MSIKSTHGYTDTLRAYSDTEPDAVTCTHMTQCVTHTNTPIHMNWVAEISVLFCFGEPETVPGRLIKSSADGFARERSVFCVFVWLCDCVCWITPNSYPHKSGQGDRQIFVVESIIWMFRISSLQRRKHITWALLSASSYLCPASVLCSDEYDIWVSVAF